MNRKVTGEGEERKEENDGQTDRGEVYEVYEEKEGRGVS